MNSDRVLTKSLQIKTGLLAVVLLVSVIGCKARATNPALNFAPVPDGAPQYSYADLVSKVAPAVVTIRADKRVRNAQQFPFFDDPFFRGIFGDRGQQPPQETLQRALGSGVIVSADGYVLTNHHVIDGAQDIKVDLNDGRTLDAKLIGSDPPSDLALLKMNSSGLPILTPGDSDKVRVGDVALAIGNPFGVGQTVTSGIVSALARSTLNINDFNFFIQTDAAVNPGNSGGPLFNSAGEVIGVNSAILSQSGGNEGVGFAIPINVVKRVAPELISTGRYRHPQVGVSSIALTDLSPQVKQQLGLTPTQKGLLVQTVTAGAQQAGVQPGTRRMQVGNEQLMVGGDIIVAIDNQTVATGGDLRGWIENNKHPGDQVTLTVLRNGQRVDIPVTLSERPQDSR